MNTTADFAEWACPHCRQTLQLDAPGGSWACVNNHRFDCAKEGYVNLLPPNRKGSRRPGDGAAMIAARRRVHEAGLYQPLADAIERLFSPAKAVRNMLDLGCGEGYYSRAMQRAQPGACLHGIDIAKPAVRTAAKRHARGHYAVASAYLLPLPDASQDIALRVFAPSDDAELHRVLSARGLYLEVTPAPGHLWELRQRLYDQPRPHAESRSAIDAMELERKETLDYQVDVDQALLREIVAMTPFAWRGHREKRERLLQLKHLTLRMNFVLCCYTLA